MTRQRALILDIIRSDKCHHTADEIFSMARERMVSASVGTTPPAVGAVTFKTPADGVAKISGNFILNPLLAK